MIKNATNGKNDTYKINWKNGSYGTYEINMTHGSYKSHLSHYPHPHNKIGTAAWPCLFYYYITVLWFL